MYGKDTVPMVTEALCAVVLALILILEKAL